MGRYNYIEILIEDQSGGILVDEIMRKYIDGREDISYRINSFRGIGKIPSKLKKVSGVKTQKLLTDLPKYLRGMDLALKNMPDNKAVFVILDCDDEDCADLKNKLVTMCQELELTIQVFFCIAIEEMEAWLLGDSEALLQAYPLAKRFMIQKYKQDSKIGTWEFLADIVYKGGVKALKAEGRSFYEIGKFKCECAKAIGKYLNIRNNHSPSFNYFIGKLDIFCGEHI